MKVLLIDAIVLLRYVQYSHLFALVTEFEKESHARAFDDLSFGCSVILRLRCSIFSVSIYYILYIIYYILYIIYYILYIIYYILYIIYYILYIIYYILYIIYYILYIIYYILYIIYYILYIACRISRPYVKHAS